MIKPLRKRHLQIWSLWALLLPVGIISATLARKTIPTTSFRQGINENILPIVIAEKQWRGNPVQLRGRTKEKAEQLVWMNKVSLDVASATIYLKNGNTTTVSSSNYVGRIESRGNYAFSLPPQKQYHFVLYDFIHQQIVDSIDFN